MEDYQQRVCNTLIKQSAGRPYCFKVGVRELGWRERYTLNGQELREPSDYRRVDIGKELSGADFNRFAYEVFKSRFDRLVRDEGPEALSASRAIPLAHSLQRRRRPWVSSAESVRTWKRRRACRVARRRSSVASTPPWCGSP